jgi:hypothetical protein
MNVLQQSIETVVQTIPVLFLEKLITQKLQEQGITPTRKLSHEIAKHIVSGSDEPFRYRGRTDARNITLSFIQSDIDEMEKAIKLFCDNQLPNLLPAAAADAAKIVLKELKARWTSESALQDVDLSNFRKRLESKWGKPFGQLRMLLTMAQEWCGDIHSRNESLKRKTKNGSREIMIRLLVRACQVTGEIICLLENGFADGAMARWRTLHEIAVVAAVISQHGDSIAERYIAHQAVESKRAMDKYQACCKQLGYKPLSLGATEKISKAYERAVSLYGKPFKSNYGWAAMHLKNDWPTFVDLEAAAGRAEMRSHYQMGNDNIHAGTKSLFVRLGLLGDYSTSLLAGRSNVGLTEPGQNAAHTLTQLCGLVCLSEPTFDDLVVGEMMNALRNEIPSSFYRVDKQLRTEDKRLKLKRRGADSNRSC